MVWFFSSKKSKQQPQQHQDITINNMNVQITVPIKQQSSQFNISQKFNRQQINSSVFRSCVTKCLKQNNSNLKKTDGIHIAVYHCMQYCGEKWENAIQIAKQQYIRL